MKTLLRQRSRILLTLLSLLCAGPAKAIDYVSSPPLGETVKTAVLACRTSKPVQLPVITWGGDLATIHANGDSRTTTPTSIFGSLGLDFVIHREDVFSEQLKAYLECRSPYLRGTVGMINMAAELASQDARTKPVVVYQMTWSVGGDAMVVAEGIRSPADLKGKSIAVQAYGPHVDYLGKILADAGLDFSQVKLRWTKDLTGSAQTPMAALQAGDVAAAMVIIPDALALTSGGSVGTGAEDSVKGAKILLSTKSANRIISDVYAVRSDYFESNRAEVLAFVRGLLLAEESLRGVMKGRESKQEAFQQVLAPAAEILMGSAQAIKDTSGMYTDAEFVGFAGNKQFFLEPSFPRNFDRLTSEIQPGFQSLGLMSKRVPLTVANWDFDKLRGGLSVTEQTLKPKFNEAEVAKIVTKKQQQGTLDDQGLFSFEVYFKPNQDEFSASLYEEAFRKVIDLASTYGGAVITVEGHSDPLAYLKKLKAGEQPLVLNRMKQAGKNLSVTRANAVRDSIIAYAKSKNITLDTSQFAVVGHGFERPKGGMCKGEPCPPKTEQEWLTNMRVEFRIIQVEAEESAFKAL